MTGRKRLYLVFIVLARQQALAALGTVTRGGEIAVWRATGQARGAPAFGLPSA